MLLNADFTKRAVVHAARIPWVSSPLAGVERRMLDRIGDEVARATSVVRYRPGSVFSPHVHDGGEEFLVLDGVFQDEHGDYPVGSYVRNPPTSRHTPRSDTGCVILVKLHQFSPNDRTLVRMDTNKMERVPDPERAGVSIVRLFRDARERVRIETLDPGATTDAGDRDGYELFVLDGTLTGIGESFEPQSWLRLPPGDRVRLEVGSAGARVWTKAGGQL